MRQSIIVLIAILAVVGGFAPVAGAATASPAGGDVAAASTVSGTTTPTAAAQSDASCDYPIELEDATGQTVTLEEAPESVVALQPSDARTVFDVGAEDRLTGMPVNPGTSDIDPGDRTDVTDGYEILTEVVVDLEPDVVLAANVTFAQDVQQLRDAGLTVYQFETAESLEDVRENALRTGQLTGECEGATQAVERMDDRLSVVESAVEDEEHPLAYYEMGEGQTTGSGTFQHEVLTTAGLENLAATVGLEGWGELNAETIVDEDPVWIVHPSWSDRPQYVESVESTTAAQEENFVSVNDNRMSQPAPQVVLAIEEIVETVHPEAYEEARASLEDGNESGSDDGSESGSGNESGDGDGSDADDGNESDADEGPDDDNESDGENGTDDDDSNADDDSETDTGDGNGSDDSDGSGTDGGSDDESDDAIPGFGIPVAVTALAFALGFGLRRR